MVHSIRCVVSVVLAVALVSGWHPISAGASTDVNPPYQATGVKIGEVTQTSAIVWTRLTKYPERCIGGFPISEAQSVSESGASESGIPDWATMEDIDGAVPGSPGEVRITYRAKDNPREDLEVPWTPVDVARDFVHQFELSDLKPKTEYTFRVDCRSGPGGPIGPSVFGRFRTAPRADDPARVLFTVITGQKYEHNDSEYGHKIYPVMAAMHPDFFVHTGDIVYMQSRWIESGHPGTAIDRARYQWNRTYGYPYQIAFHKMVPSYFIKDDHDIGRNDCYPGKDLEGFTYEQGITLFREQNPSGEVPYRTVRWGKDLQVWMVEGRDFRSPNDMPDGPDKTIWGATQKEWLKTTVLESDATFKVLISPTPIVGPDRETKGDNHSNSNWSYEGNEIRQWIHDSAPDLMVVCGDRHWQYVSVDPATGVREYSCGPASDVHAGGWDLGFVKEYHRYLNVVGGFLSGTVERADGIATLTFRHHDVAGTVLFQDQHVRKDVQ